MLSIFRSGTYRILKVFYDNRNHGVHLREIARRTGMNENSVVRYLSQMTDDGVMKFKVDGNLKKFFLKKRALCNVFPVLDSMRLEGLPRIRRRAIEEFMGALDYIPVFAVVFGSTAKGTFRDDSDVDLLLVFNEKVDCSLASKRAEAQTGIRVQCFQMSFKDFEDEVKLKKDPVVQSAIDSGFPVFNPGFFYEVVFDE